MRRPGMLHIGALLVGFRRQWPGSIGKREPPPPSPLSLRSRLDARDHKEKKQAHLSSIHSRSFLLFPAPLSLIARRLNRLEIRRETRYIASARTNNELKRADDLFSSQACAIPDTLVE